MTTDKDDKPTDTTTELEGSPSEYREHILSTFYPDDSDKMATINRCDIYLKDDEI